VYDFSWAVSFLLAVAVLARFDPYPDTPVARWHVANGRRTSRRQRYLWLRAGARDQLWLSSRALAVAANPVRIMIRGRRCLPYTWATHRQT